jgi:hypothetical protein
MIDKDNMISLNIQTIWEFFFQESESFFPDKIGETEFLFV